MIKNRWKYSCSKNSQTSDSHALNTVSWFHAEHCESSQVFFFLPNFVSEQIQVFLHLHVLSILPSSGC